MADFFYGFFVICLGIFPIAFGMVVVLAYKQRRSVGVGMLAAYLLVYVLLSVNGQYITANHGGSDWSRSWCPAFVEVAYRAPTGRQKTNPTLLASIFWPCLLLDRWLWHRDKDPWN